MLSVAQGAGNFANLRACLEEDFLTAKGAENAKGREEYIELLLFASFASFAVFSSNQTE
jgi:hypothetical protein